MDHNIGPGAGVHGGHIVAQGKLQDICSEKEIPTGAYLSGSKQIAVPKKRRSGNGLALNIVGASLNNLKNIDIEIPLNKFVVVTGVSGSGKSTLVNDLLYQYLRHCLFRNLPHPRGIIKVNGVEQLDKVIDIDQAPIGRTPRSNPATYTGLFDVIRDVFAMTTEAKLGVMDLDAFHLT